MAPVGFGPMGFSSDLNDLAMLMDSNMQHASTIFSLPSSSVMPSSESDRQSLPSQSSEAEAQEPLGESAHSSDDLHNFNSASQSFALAGTASISLALSQAFAKNSLLSTPRPPFSSAQPQAQVSSLALPVKQSSTPSQKKCHAPMPVMSATKVVAQQAATTVEPSFKAFRLAPTNFTAFPDLLRMPANNGYGLPNSGAAMRKAAIVWFRNDLRIHDNEALAAANNEALSVLPVYCFDPCDYGKSSSGFDKTGPYRAKFLLESVADLRSSLRARGSELVVRVGKPEEVLLELAKAVGADALYAHQEVTHEELRAEAGVCAALKEHGVETNLYWGSTLYHIEDLPFKSLDEMPANYGGFKEKTSAVKVRPTAEVPKKLKSLPSRGGVKAGEVPSLQDLGVGTSAKASQEKSVGGTALIGGESEALKRLAHFVSEARSQSRQAGKESLMGANFSCKISPWLAMGCLSPRRMYQDLRADATGASTVASAEGGVDDKSGLNWLVFELLWRDFFRFITKKYGSSTRKGATAAPAMVGSTV